jgi:O-antigen ligase
MTTHHLPATEPWSAKSVVQSVVLGVAMAGALVVEPLWVARWLPANDLTTRLLHWPAALTTVIVLAGLAITSVWHHGRRRPTLHLIIGVIAIAFQCMGLRAGPVNLLNITIVALAAWWLADVALNPQRPRPTPLVAHLLLALGVLAVVSRLYRPDIGASLGGLLMLLPKLAMAWILAHALRDALRLEVVMRMLVLASVGAALIGIAQSALYVFSGLELHLMEDTAPRYITVLGWPLLRASGLMPNPQAYTYPLMLSALWLGYHVVAGRSADPIADRSGMRRRAWAALCAMLVLTGIVLSFARGPWLASGAMLLLLPALARQRMAGWWFGLLAVALLAALVSGVGRSLFLRFGEFTSSSAEVRIQLLVAGMESLAEHPWRGVGLAGFGSLSPTFERYPVHNAPLQLGVELGLPALIVYCTLLLAPLFQAVSAAHRLRALCLAYSALLLAIQADPMAYSEFVFFSAVLLDAARRIWCAPGAHPSAPASTTTSA